jgi:hypothetical protein
MLLAQVAAAEEGAAVAVRQLQATLDHATAQVRCAMRLGVFGAPLPETMRLAFQTRAEMRRVMRRTRVVRLYSVLVVPFLRAGEVARCVWLVRHLRRWPLSASPIFCCHDCGRRCVGPCERPRCFPPAQVERRTRERAELRDEVDELRAQAIQVLIHALTPLAVRRVKSPRRGEESQKADHDRRLSRWR